VSVQIEEIKCDIRVLPFVTKLSPLRAHKGHGAGWGVSLTCSASEEYDSCGKKQEPPLQVSSVHPTELTYLQEVLKRLQGRHVDCAEAVDKAKARAKTTNKVPLESEKEKDAAESHPTAKDHLVVGARHARVCEDEDLDPSRVVQISWWQVVHVLSRPLGQKTSSQSHHQQGFGITRKG
jgi:hypothetical protein